MSVELIYQRFASYSKNSTNEVLSTEQSQDSLLPRVYPWKKCQRQQSRKSEKIKVELCRTYLKVGACPYLNKCTFAHGSHQLRINNATNSKYKTKECSTFFKTGFCLFGDRCNFLHYRINKHSEPRTDRSIDTPLRQVIIGSRPHSIILSLLKSSQQ